MKYRVGASPTLGTKNEDNNMKDSMQTTKLDIVLAVCFLIGVLVGGIVLF